MPPQPVLTEALLCNSQFCFTILFEERTTGFPTTSIINLEVIRKKHQYDKKLKLNSNVR